MSRNTVLIYNGDDFERLAELFRAVKSAERAARMDAEDGTARDGDDEASDLQEARDAYDTFVGEAAERAEEWVLESIGWEEYRNLLRDHPPRASKDVDGKPKVDDNGDEILEPEDEGFGVNVETFPRALLTFVDPDDDEVCTIVKPEFVSGGEFRKRLKRLSKGEFDTLWSRAAALNTGLVGDPKAAAYWTASPSRDVTST